MTTEEAIIEACKILKDEANELACLQTMESWKPLPHRARVAIGLEIERLRRIASALKPPDSK